MATIVFVNIALSDYKRSKHHTVGELKTALDCHYDAGEHIEELNCRHMRRGIGTIPDSLQHPGTESMRHRRRNQRHA